MPSNNEIGTKKGSIIPAFMQRTGNLLSSAASSYIKEAMPVTHDLVKDASNTVLNVSKAFKGTSNTIIKDTLNSIKKNANMKNILNWYMDASDEYGIPGGGDFEDFDFDTSFDDSSFSDFSEIQMTEGEKNSNKVAKSIVDSQKMSVEANINLTATLSTKIDEQTAAITAGFDSTKAILEKILEVVTKNTSTLIETSTAAATLLPDNKMSTGDQLISSNKFNLKKYMDYIKENQANSELGIMMSMVQAFANPDTLKMFLTPDTLVEEGTKFVLNRLFPSMETMLKSVDDSLNQLLMDTIINLGDLKLNDPLLQNIVNGFGLSSNKKSFSGGASASLAVEKVSFDSLTRESIVGAIPGYLRKILNAVGGGDYVYDLKSKKFIKGSDVRDRFLDSATNIGSRSQDANIRRIFGNDEYSGMIYDLMINDLGYRKDDFNRNSKDIIKSFSNNGKFAEYVKGDLLKNITLSDEENEYIDKLEERLRNNMDGYFQNNLMKDVMRSNIKSNMNMKEYLADAELYHVDNNGLRSGRENERQYILEQYGMDTSTTASLSGQPTPGSALSGVDYTNRALYEIYRRLDKGINVFKIGEANKRNMTHKAFPEEKLLPPPTAFSPKNSNNSNQKASRSDMDVETFNNQYTDEENLLMKKDEEDNRTAGEKFRDWSGHRTSQLSAAIFSGDPQRIQEVIGASIKDVAEISGEALKDGAQKINMQFGNVTGSLRHQLLGTAYEYTDDNGNLVKVDKNEKGGIFGFIGDYFKDSFNSLSEKGKNWWNEVSGFFADDSPSGDNDDADKGVKSKRKRLIGASIGAMAGAGILGGPIGLIMGSLAGAGLSGLGIGDKIKNMLFGRDDKGKAKGLLTKIGDGIVDPIRYQFSKTVDSLGKNIKNNILGPLSDIGSAIKDRIVNAAGERFGKVFSFIGKIVTAPFKAAFNGATSLAKLPITLIGNITRGITDTAGGMVGSTLSGIADTIAIGGKHTAVDENGNEFTLSSRKNLKARRKARKESSNDTEFASYKDWKSAQDTKRAERLENFKSYFSEQKEVVDNTAEISEATQSSAEALEHLDQMASDDNCISVHDLKIHEYLEKMIELVKSLPGGGKGEEFSEFNNTLSAGEMLEHEENKDNADHDNFANGILGASTQVAAEGEITDQDERTLINAAKEAAKDDSDPGKMTSYYTSLLSSQKEFMMEQKEEESIFDTIWKYLTEGDGLIGTIGKILAAVGIIGGIAEVLGTGIGNFFKNFTRNIENAINSFFPKRGNDKNKNDDNSDDDGTSGVNTILNLFDADVDSIWDLINPFATVDHAQKDAVGEDIANQDLTEDKVKKQVYKTIWDMVKNSHSEYKNGKYLNETAPKITNEIQGTKAELSAEAKTLERQYNTHIDDISKNKEIIAENEKIISDYESGSAKYSIDEVNEARSKISKANTEIEVSTNAAKEIGEQQSSTAAKLKDVETKATEHANTVNEAKANLEESRVSASHTGSRMVHEFANQVGQVAIISGAGTGVHYITSEVLQRMGFDEETSEYFGGVTGAVTSAGLTAEAGISMMKGRTPLVGKILDGLKKIFMTIAGYLKLTPMLEKFGTKIDGFFDNLFNGISKKITGFIEEKIAKRIAEKLGKEATEATLKQIAGAVSEGIIIAAAGIIGAISGGLSAEHLFQVLPGQADGTMTTISAILEGALMALETVPGIGYAILAFEIIDDMIIKGLFDKTFIQGLAQFLYNLIQGDQGKHLTELQKGLEEERIHYNEKYGTDLSMGAFNDMVNNDGIIDTAWRGGMEYDEDGHLKFDEGGGQINGGIKGFIFGKERQYMHDENGAILHDENGMAIAATDEYGNEIYSDSGVLSDVTNWVGRKLTGTDVYETDENGVAVVDENGEKKVIGHEKGFTEYWNEFFEGTGADIYDFVHEWQDTFESTGEAIYDFFHETGEKISNFVGPLIDSVKNVFKQMKEGQEYTLSLMDDPDSDIADLFTGLGEGDGSILSYLSDGLTLGSRLSVIPGLFIKRIGEEASEWIGGILGDFKNEAGGAIEAISSKHDEIAQATDAMDYSKLIWMDTTSGKEGLFGNLASSLIFVDRNLHLIPIFLKLLGGKISHAFGNLKEIASDSFDSLTTNIGATATAAFNGDTIGMWQLDYQSNEDNPLDGIIHGITIGSKLVYTIPSIMFFLGRRLKEFFDDMGILVTSGMDLLNTNVGNMSQDIISGNYEGVWDYEYQGDEGNPMNGVMSAVISTSKLVYVPMSLIFGAGNAIRETFNGIIDKVKTVIGQNGPLFTGLSNIFSAAISGDTTELISLNNNDIVSDPNNPMAGIAGGIFDTAKVIATPISLIVGFGKDVKKVLSDKFAPLANDKKLLDKAIDQLAEHGVKGDLDGLDKVTFTPSTDNPLGGLYTLFFKASRMIQMVPGLINYGINKIKKGASILADGARGWAEDIFDWLKGGPDENKKKDKKDNESVGGPSNKGPLNKAYSINSEYGERTGTFAGMHKGVDLSPADNSTSAEVSSTHSGIVRYVKNDVSDSDHADKKSDGKWIYSGKNETGNMIVIDSADGTRTKFMHLKANSIPDNLKPGTKVGIGTKLGTMGSTGRSTGAHLHYQVEKNATELSPFDSSNAVNPIPYLNAANSNYPFGGPRIGGDGLLSKVSDIIGEVGSKFLSTFTLGILDGESSSSSSDGEDTSDISSNYSGDVDKLNDFIKLLEGEVGTKSSPPGSNNNKYNTWYYGKPVSGDAYPWCMAFVQWAFNEAGYELPYRTPGCAQLWSYYEQNDPSKINKKPKAGDIIIFGGSGHTGIVVKTGSGSDFETIEGNYSDAVTRVNHNLTEGNIRGFIRAVDWESMKSTSKAKGSMSTQDLWNYFKKKGYNDVAISGILGCWSAESGNEPRKLEGYYLPQFDSYGGYNMIDDRSKMDKWAEHVISVTPQANRDGYIGPDGHLYPGIGLAQWTGKRGKELLEFAKKKGMSWDDVALQLMFMETELAGAYGGVKNSIQNAKTPEEAARIFARQYEGNTLESYFTERGKLAKQMLSKFGGKKSTGVGGPDFMDNTISTLNNIKDRLQTFFNEINYSSSDSEEGTGGPDESAINIPELNMNDEKVAKGGEAEKIFGKNFDNDKFSSINNKIFKQKASINLNEIGGPEEPVISIAPMRANFISSNNDIIEESDNKDTKVDLKPIETLLTQVILELTKITNNTSSSNDLLGSLNEKDFVDKGLRDTLSNTKAKKNKPFGKPSSTSSAKTVARMAMP